MCLFVYMFALIYMCMLKCNMCVSIPGQECLGSYSSDNIMFTSLLSAPGGKRNDNNKRETQKKGYWISLYSIAVSCKKPLKQISQRFFPIKMKPELNFNLRKLPIISDYFTPCIELELLSIRIEGPRAQTAVCWKGSGTSADVAQSPESIGQYKCAQDTMENEHAHK